MKRIIILIAIIAPAVISIAQEEIWMHPNRGQWHQNISYKIEVPGGNMFLEKTGFTYDFSNIKEIYHAAHEPDHQLELKGHVVKTTFLNAQEPIFEESDQASHYENYFIGKDPSKWASKVYPCEHVDYLSLYDGINLSIYESDATLKYDIIVAPGADPAQFKVQYEGQDAIYIDKSGQLIVKTKLGDLIEGAPVAYQKINGLKKKVACNYVLEDDIMHFEFPDGYDSAYELVIDPSLTFSTFTGATSDNWGMTACPDANKNLVAAGVVFGTGYPFSTGAYDPSMNGGQTDIGLTKFNADGTSLIFSTFLGGAETETPHSLVVNDNNELYVFGATSSQNFPVSGSGYQQTHAGGPTVQVSNYINYDSGPDMFITKFTADGTGVLGSTYYGGNDIDGITWGNSTLYFNYGDQIRGSIMVDDQSNVYIASTTRSTNIGIQGGFQGAINGTSDGIVAKFNSNLSNLLWSSYLGGSGLDAAYSVDVASNGDVFVCGGTTSSNFPATSGNMNGAFQGGISDGFVTRFSAPTYNNPRSTYLGTNDYDQAYFVQLDPDDFVYIYGQTKGGYPNTPGHYSNPQSGQFIHKISNNLTTSQWSSTFGASSGNEELSPTAFLVSDCYRIYVAGWGGSTNQSGQAVNSSSTGMPLTGDAYQSQTNGSNFYLGVFDADMMNLDYGTYMGSTATNGHDHVDGGTSRFDKQGGVYHAVCAACGNSGFPTTPGVWAPNNGSQNCNLAAFQFDLSKIDATLSAANPVVCFPDAVDFINDSQNGNAYEWHFGDGNTSTQFEPSHNYAGPGTYSVMLIVSDVNGCFTPDTAYLDVTVELSQAQAGALSDTICPGTSVELWATGGSAYAWGPANLLDDPASSNPIATITQETTFTVDVTSTCGNSQVEVTVSVYDVNTAISPDTAICIGESAPLWVTGGATYVWTPPGSLDDPNIANPTATPTTTTDYYVDITTADGCFVKDTTQVWVDLDLPFPVLEDSLNLCKGASQQITITGGTSYIWTPNYNINDVSSSTPTIYPEVDTTYYVDAINACGVTPDSIHVSVIEVTGEVNPDTTVCPGESAILWATGGVQYHWSPSAHLTGSTQATTVATPPYNTQYRCIITDENGCKDTQYTHVYLFPTPAIEVSPAVYAVLDDTINIWAQGNGVITWSPDYNISCIECTDPYVWPEQSFVYTATITDANGCKNWAEVPIYFDPLIYIPNAFTVNGDGINDYFKAQGYNIIEFEMLIFNRWGELIKTLSSLDESWDGTYQGVPVPDGVYVWQVRYVDLDLDPHMLRGHVVVLK